MNSLQAAELKELATKHNLSTAGTKLELINRLTEAGVSEEEVQEFMNLSRLGAQEEATGSRVDHAYEEERHVRLIQKMQYEIELLNKQLEVLKLQQVIRDRAESSGARSPEGERPIRESPVQIQPTPVITAREAEDTGREQHETASLSPAPAN